MLTTQFLAAQLQAASIPYGSLALGDSTLCAAHQYSQLISRTDGNVVRIDYTAAATEAQITAGNALAMNCNLDPAQDVPTQQSVMLQSLGAWLAGQLTAGFSATVNGVSYTFPLDPTSQAEYNAISTAFSNGDLTDNFGALSQSLTLPTTSGALVTITATADWTAFRKAAFTTGRNIKEQAAEYQAAILEAATIAALNAITFS